MAQDQSAEVQESQEVAKLPELMSERPSYRGKGSLFARLTLLAAAVGGGTVVGTGCADEFNPAGYTVDHNANEPLRDAVKEEFKLVPLTQTRLIGEFSDGRNWILETGDIWPVDSVVIHVRHLMPGGGLDSRGSLTILTSEDFNADPNKEYRGFLISDKGTQFVIGDIDINPAEELIREEMLAPENRDNLAIRVNYESPEGTRVAETLKEEGGTFYLQAVDKVKHEPIPDSLKAFHFSPPASSTGQLAR